MFTGSPHHSPRFQARSDKEPSFDTCLAQDAVTQPSSIFLGMNRHPDFFAGRGMLQQEVTAERPEIHDCCPFVGFVAGACPAAVKYFDWDDAKNPPVHRRLWQRSTRRRGSLKSMALTPALR